MDHLGTRSACHSRFFVYVFQLKLRGPDSPLLMKFSALTRSGSSKPVKMNTSSVNSTALDLEPQNPHDR